jgi:hypothetical protein
MHGTNPKNVAVRVRNFGTGAIILGKKKEYAEGGNFKQRQYQNLLSLPNLHKT